MKVQWNNFFAAIAHPIFKKSIAPVSLPIHNYSQGQRSGLKSAGANQQRYQFSFKKNTEIFEKVSKNVGVNAPLKIYRCQALLAPTLTSTLNFLFSSSIDSFPYINSEYANSINFILFPNSLYTRYSYPFLKMLPVL